jgi:hypothetical protein
VRIVTALDRWIINLHSGARLAVWADGYSESGDDLVFSVLVDRDADEPAISAVEVVGTTPSNPRRVEIVIARIPRLAVSDIVSG